MPGENHFHESLLRGLKQLFRSQYRRSDLHFYSPQRLNTFKSFTPKKKLRFRAFFLSDYFGTKFLNKSIIKKKEKEKLDTFLMKKYLVFGSSFSSFLQDLMVLLYHHPKIWTFYFFFFS